MSPKILALAMAATLVAQPVHAKLLTYNFNVSDLGVGNILKGDGYAPVPSDVSAPGWPNGSFVSDLSSTPGQRYTQLDVDLNLAFETTGLTLGDLAGITYYTKKGDASLGLDWAIRIYTQPTSGEQWYGTRFDGKNPDAADTDWNLWDADSPDWFIGGNVAGVGALTLSKSLTELHADYGNLELNRVTFYVGSSLNNWDIANHLDGITFTLTNGDQVEINLIPEPGTYAMLLTGMAGLGFLCRRRKVLTES